MVAKSLKLCEVLAIGSREVLPGKGNSRCKGLKVGESRPEGPWKQPDGGPVSKEGGDHGSKEVRPQKKQGKRWDLRLAPPF